MSDSDSANPCASIEPRGIYATCRGRCGLTIAAAYVCDEDGLCGPCHHPEGESDFVTTHSFATCPSCGAYVAHLETYDIGSGPELSCPNCEWCWGAEGQSLKPLSLSPAQLRLGRPEGGIGSDDPIMTTTRENIMEEQALLGLARKRVFDYVQARLEKTDTHVTFGQDEVYVVWFSKTLQNWKALVSTMLPDGMYYEVTYNGDKQETYIDAYKKFENVVVPD